MMFQYNEMPQPALHTQAPSPPGKAASRHQSVRRLVRLLRLGVGRGEEGEGVQVVGGGSVLARRVFGVKLVEHLVHAGSVLPPPFLLIIPPIIKDLDGSFLIHFNHS